MITRTEVLKAIAIAGPHAGFATIDNSLATISRGDLFALIEAAKCARYEVVDGHLNNASSNSGTVLDYRDRPDRDYGEDAEEESQ